MDEIKDLKEWLLTKGVIVPERIHTREGVKKYLEAQRAIHKLSVMNWEERYKMQKVKLEAIEKALERLEGDAE